MKTIVITGTTSGIGLAIAKHFSKNNRIFCGYRNSEKIKLIEDLKGIPFFIDMIDGNSIAKAAEYIKSQTDKIDILINVAGCVTAGVIETLDINKLREQFEVNTFSHLDFTQRLIEKLENGKIINISSMASFGIFPFISPYCASKRALDILFNSLMLETKHNIKVISVKPGVIATPLWKKSIEKNKDSIENCKGFEKEMEFMVQNAKENEKKGLPVSDVVKVIEKIERTKNPKPSYTIGIDAKAAQMISLLPQSIINKLISFKLSKRICS